MLSLPPFIMTSGKGSFPQVTMAQRKPMIIETILSKSDYPSSIRQDLVDFQHEIKTLTIKPLSEKTSDRGFWDQALHPWLGKTWFDIPWFFAETYFYRRILEIVHYFQPGPWYKRDPFYPMKNHEITQHLPQFLKFYQPSSHEKSLTNFQFYSYNALWGNRGDLSLHFDNPDISNGEEEFIVNHVEDAYIYLEKGRKRIAYFLDNATMEIFYDLALVDFLLQTNIADTITCYAKDQPYFLSDALPEDVYETLDLLSASFSEKVQSLANRLKIAFSMGRLTLKAPPFLTTSAMFRELPASLRTELESHDLCILKGDANYRRLMGDRHWNPTTPLNSVVNYFPTSFLSLRTPKSEVMVGIPESTYQELINTAEPDWQTNGKRGMITFWKK
jgi:uncharacterized protein with ATP-grasp and redox domains